MDIDSLLIKARDLAEKGNREESRMCLLAILKEQPEHIAALLMLGGAYFVDKNYREARVVFEKLVSLKPGVGQYSVALFNTLIKLQLVDDALEEIRRFMSVADKTAEKETIDQYLAVLEQIETARN
jgi:tetratricopeptide (TPR) repeat protein